MYSALLAFLFDIVGNASIFDEWLDSESELHAESLCCSETVKLIFANWFPSGWLSGFSDCTWFVNTSFSLSSELDTELILSLSLILLTIGSGVVRILGLAVETYLFF